MDEFSFLDAVRISKPRRTRDGYLTARVHAARTGVQEYLGADVGKPELDRVSVYRPEDEVFDMDSLGSYKGKPITVGHPGERVTSKNHRDLARGHIANVARDGQSVALDVAITDAETVAALESGGPRELSAGYLAKIDFTPGITEDGQEYDAIQRDIFIDHLAIVPKGRAGSDFRIGDDAIQWGVSPFNTNAEKEGRSMADSNLQIMVLGDEAVHLATADAPKVKAWADAQSKAMADASEEIKTLQAKVDEKEGELKAVQKALDEANSPAAIADAVAARAQVLKVGKEFGLSDADMEGMANSEIKRRVVTNALSDEEAKAMSDSAIDGAFSFAAKAKPTRHADALSSGIATHDADPWAAFDNRKGA